jgi:hypothetical protein
MSICQGFFIPTIFKIRWYYNIDSYKKLIFVGHCEKGIQNILKKLENGYESTLTKTEIAELNTIFPNYQKLFGDIINGNTIFIYNLLDDSDCIMHIMEDLHRYLKIDLKDIYLWYIPRILSSEYFNQQIKFIFDGQQSIKNEEFTSKMIMMSGGLSLNELKTMLILGLPNKYKSVDNIKFFDREQYYLNSIINSDDFKILVEQFPISLSTRNFYIKGEEKIFFLKYTNPLLSVINNYTNDEISGDQFIAGHDDQYYKQLQHHGRILNNELFMIARHDFSKLLPSKLTAYYFPISEDSKNIIQSESTILNRQSVILSYPINLRHIIEKSVNIENCSIKELVIVMNPYGYMANELNLTYIFNKTRVYSSMPIIKIYNDGICANVKLFNSFIKTENEEIIHKMITFSNMSYNIPNEKNGAYITFVCYLERNSYMNCYLFATGEFKVSLQFLNYTSIARVKGFINIANLIIKKIIDITKSTIFKTIELNSIFEHQSVSMPLSILNNAKMTMEYKISHLPAKIGDHLFKKMVESLRKLSRYISFRDVNVSEPNINLIFKSTDDFYNPDNIRAYIAMYKTQKGDKLSPTDINKLEDIIERYFFIDKKIARNYISEVNITTETYGHFKFSIYVDLTISKNSIVFHFERIANFAHVRKFLQYINVILYDLLEDVTPTHSHIIMSHMEKTVATASIKTTNELSLDALDYIDDENKLDIDYSELENIELEQAAPESPQQQPKAEVSDLALDFQKQNKGRNLKFSTYMTQMREKADPELYSEIENYNKSCPAQNMRQPYIVSKKELETFDPKALTGAMKYRNNYYICPRIWDVKARKPISNEEFIKNGMKSPYTGGIAIPPNKRTEHELDDKYTVIVRKPRSDNYWADPVKDKNLPEMLKGTGAAAYPGLIHLGEHPKKFCAPCCYKHKPDDMDEVESASVRIFDKFYGWDKCSNVSETEKKRQLKRPASENPKCLNENYILDKTADLEHCRLGLLPDNLDLLLNNNQHLFLNTSHNALRDNANCFLKRGVFFNGKNSNFLRCIDNIKEFYNLEAFKKLLVRILTPELFITLNNGDLVKIYCSNDLLPNMNTPSKMDAFKDFIKKSSIVSLLFDVKVEDIDNLKVIIKKSLLFDDSVKGKLADDVIYAQKKFKNIYILYQIMTAYMNYINNILNPDDSIDYRHLLDLISRPNDLLFPSGVNIIIFDKSTQKVQCNPYAMNTRNMIILINENDRRFTPIYHIRVKHNNIKLFGVIRISENINLDNETVSYYTQIHKNASLINVSRIRVSFLQNLYFIHSNICFINKKSVIYMKISDYLKFFYTEELHVKAQVITNTSKVQYVLLSNGYLLPVYPTHISISTAVEYLSDVKLNNNLLEAWSMYKLLAHNEHILKMNLHFQPKKLLVKLNSKEMLAIGIEFDNGLMVPIMPQPIPEQLATIPTKKQTFYTDFTVSIKDEKLHIQQLLFQDYLYQQFKYEFSMYINEYNNKVIKATIKDNLNFVKLPNIIKNIMKPIISMSLRKTQNSFVEVMPGVSISTCYNIKNASMCNRNIFCESAGDDSNKCGIHMNVEMLELFAYLLSQDILNNSNERMYIMDGKYIPMLHMNNRLLARVDESIVDGQQLYNEIKNIRMEQYHNNLPLTDYLGKKDVTHILSNVEYEEIKTSMERERIRSINKLSNILANISLDYLLPEHLTIATPFDNEGRINVRMGIGPCIFPYLDTSNYKLVYNCGKNEKQLLTCPTQLNLDRKPVKWGYCPEDPNITKKRMHVVPIDTIKSKHDDSYQEGRCIFPFIDKYNNLRYDCMKDMNDNGNEFSWCPIKFKNISDFAPVAARDLNQIWKDKWRYKGVFKHNSNKISDDFMNISAKGYCQPPEDKGIEVYNEGVEVPITMETYQPLNCLDTPSKGGYTKEQLYAFGKNVLKIPYVLMKKGDNKLGKKYLCKLVNDRFRELKMASAEEKQGNVYDRDVDKCLLGEKKGGYKLQDLRELGVQHFGLSVERANLMSKPELCDYIVPIIKKSKSNEDIIETIKENEDIASVYKKNIDLCAKSKKRGGYSRKELIDIAIHKLGLKITNDMLKDEICKLVKDKILTVKALKKQEQMQQQQHQNLSESTVESEMGHKRIKTAKLERAHSFRDLDILNNNTKSQYTMKSLTRKKSSK